MTALDLTVFDTAADDLNLVLDQPDDPLAEWNKKAHAAVEPFDARAALRSLKIGDELEVTDRFYRHATVQKVAAGKALVGCSILTSETSVPEGKTKPVAFPKVVTWHEVWEVQDVKRQDPEDPRRTWTEKHCIVTQEDRPQQLRSGSVLINTTVKAVRGPRSWKLPEVPPPVVPEPAPAVTEPKPQAVERMTFWKAQKLAREKGIDISDLTGAGALEKIMERVNAQTVSVPG